MQANGSKIGYTRAQAERLKRQLEKDMARIEDAALTMKGRVPDTSVYVEIQLEELRERYHELVATVDRRTR